MHIVRRWARARLGSRVIRRLRQAGVDDARYHARSFSVRFTPPGRDTPVVVRLEDLLVRAAADRRQRRAQVDRFVAGLLPARGAPVDWARVRPLLRPVLRDVAPLGPGVGAPLRRPALPYLAEYVVLDEPDTMTYVAADQPRGWGVGAAEVFAAARANLTRAAPLGAAAGPMVLQFVDDGDAYWASHLLLDGWLAGLAEQVGGRPVAFVPERGTLLVAADGGAHLPELFDEVERAYLASPRAISPMAYVSDEQGAPVPYRAPPGHPLHDCVGRAEAVLATCVYARQAELMDSAAELDDAAAPAGAAAPADAAALVVVRGADGWRTRALWPHDRPVLLPAAAEVLVGDRPTPWAELTPYLTPVPGLEPPRWRAAAHPPGPG